MKKPELAPLPWKAVTTDARVYVVASNSQAILTALGEKGDALKLAERIVEMANKQSFERKNK